MTEPTDSSTPTPAMLEAFQRAFQQQLAVRHKARFKPSHELTAYERMSAEDAGLRAMLKAAPDDWRATPPAAAEPQSITIDHLPGTTGDSLEDGIAYLKAAAVEPLTEALRDLADRADRARSILTDGKPTPSCNWGMLDTTVARAALSHAAPARNGGETGEASERNE
jgi:hypothetical protein